MKTLRKTKIIATLGPSSNTLEIMEQMLLAGMNVARLNFSHGTHAEHKEKIDVLRQASKNTGIPVALLLDTCGPQIRTGKVGGDGTIILANKEKFILTTEDIVGSRERLSINYVDLPKEVSKNSRILIADGLVELHVEKVDGNDIHCVVHNGGSFRSYKNVSVPGIHLSLPAITEKDYQDIEFAIQEDMDFLAVSFVQSSDDIELVQSILDKKNNKIKVIAKIETRKALDNIAPISKVAHGVMVARGDLGIQINPEEVPIAQKRIIRTCNTLGKIVITATQMLESMVSNIRPTRAEASDVANAILDGTDAIMLSGETASGQHPVVAIEMMHTIALDIENSLEFYEAPKHTFTRAHNIGSAVSKAAYQLAKEISANVICIPSIRGNTPLIISKFRPRPPIIAITPSEITHRQLLLCWGVQPFISPYASDHELLIRKSIDLARNLELVNVGGSIVSIAGLPLESPALLNAIRVHFIGRILLRARDGIGQIACGPTQIVDTPSKAEEVLKQDKDTILLVETLDASWENILQSASGVICHNHVRNLTDIRHKFKQLTMVCGIHSRLTALKNKQFVYISGKNSIVYEEDI